MRSRNVRTLPVRPDLRLQGRAGISPRQDQAVFRYSGNLVITKRKRPKLAVWKFASCDGCQLSLLDCEDELLTLAGEVEFAWFPEASRKMSPPPYDLSLVEGSITTAEDVERIHEVRKQSKTLVTIGACATAGGIQALRNFRDVKEFISIVYARPDYIDTLATSTAIADHVPVDMELRGCPINKYQLLELISALINGRQPHIATHSVCVLISFYISFIRATENWQPCPGPVTQAGCGAICPACLRGCYGCFGPQDTANTDSLGNAWLQAGKQPDELKRIFHNFNAAAEPFAVAGSKYDQDDHR